MFWMKVSLDEIVCLDESVLPFIFLTIAMFFQFDTDFFENSESW